MQIFTEFPGAGPATLPEPRRGRGTLYVVRQGGGLSKTSRSGHSRHAETRPQTALDRPLQW